MDQENNSIFKLRRNFSILFIVLVILACFSISYIEKGITNSYLKQTTKTYEKAYNTIYTQYKELADVVFTGLLQLSDLKKRFETIENLSEIEQESLRDHLYKKTVKRYKTLKLKHIKSINYILPDNRIFLKVRKPSDSGDMVSEYRHTIKHIHQHKQPVDSYEIGRYGAGYRFVYPLISNGRYLGVVGITFGEEAITSSMMRQYDVLSNFYIKEESFDKDLLTKNENRYIQSHHKGYLFDSKVLKELKKASNLDTKELQPNQQMLQTLYDSLNTNQSATSYYDTNTKTVFTHIPIFHKLTNKKEAILTIRSEISAINILEANYLAIHLLMIGFIAVTLYLIYQHYLKLIREKKSLQENMQKDKQLLEQAKMAQMGEMIGNIAHQWRQPLSTISTAASGIKVNQEYDMLKPEDIPTHMDIILKNVDYLSQTIDTFRNFIKEDATVMEVLLQDKIDNTIELISATLNQHHIKLINNVDYSEPIKIRVITGALPQVIMNIINNAKDIIVEKGIDGGWVKIEALKQENNAIITIEDNGGGIPKEIVPKIFDPYFTTKHQSVGTGLGLFMSHKIVTEHHNGKLHVTNTQNGAKFTIEIPLTKEKGKE